MALHECKKSYPATAYHDCYEWEREREKENRRDHRVNVQEAIESRDVKAPEEEIRWKMGVTAY